MTAQVSDNGFKIMPGGLVTEIIDSTGDGVGNGLIRPLGIEVDGSGNVYVTGNLSKNAFKITPDGVITQIIDASGDGARNPLRAPFGIAVDGAGNVYVSGKVSYNVFVMVSCTDNDGDGSGFPGSTLCPNGSAEDCDDADPNNFPGGTEVCDGQDNDCNGIVDDDQDSDGDGVSDCNDQCPGLDDSLFAPDCVEPIPTVSDWGLVILTLLLLTAWKIHFGRKRGLEP